jgi:hypothetical protein
VEKVIFETKKFGRNFVHVAHSGKLKKLFCLKSSMRKSEMPQIVKALTIFVRQKKEREREKER